MSKAEHRQFYRPRPAKRLPGWLWRLWSWC
jgi:hypothetical protein